MDPNLGWIINQERAHGTGITPTGDRWFRVTEREVTGGLQVLSWALKLSTRECKQLDGGRHRKRLGTQLGGTVTTQVFQSHSALSDEVGLEQSHTTGRWQIQPQGYFSTGLCSPI